MTNKRKSIDELRFLSIAIDESILRASDGEVSEELASLGIDPAKTAAEMDSIAHEAKRITGKSRLARAKDAANTFRSKSANLSRENRSTLRAKFQGLQSGRSGENDGLMMAARKGKETPPSDEETVLDDLAQLDALESEDPKTPKE